MARARAVGANDSGHPEPARRLDPHRQHAVRSWPPLLTLANHAIVATDLVHSDRLGRGPFCAAGRRRLVPAVGRGLGTDRRSSVTAVCGCPHRGGNETGLSRDPRAPRTHAPHPGLAAGSGAVIISTGGWLEAAVARLRA